MIDLTRKQSIGVVLATLLTLGLSLWIGLRSSEHSFFLKFKQGDLLTYDMKSLTTTKALPLGTPNPLNGAGEFKTQMIAKVFSVTKDEVLMGMQFDKIVYKLNSDLVDQVYLDMYSIPFLVTLSTSGSIKDMFFSNTISESDEEFLKSMLYNFDVVQEEASKVWGIKQKNLFGEYEAIYSQIKPDLLSKKIVKYLTYDKPVKISIEDSNSSYILDNNSSWFKTFNMDEKSVMTIGNGSSKVKVHSKVSVSPSIAKPYFNLKLLSFKTAGELLDFLTQKKDKEIKSLVERINDQNFQQQLISSGIDAMAFVQMFIDGKLSSYELKKRLIQYLLLYPDKAYELLELIRQKKVDEHVAISFIGALVEVGHYQAQKAISEIIWDDSINSKVRQNAGMMVGFLKSPNDETISSIWGYYDTHKKGDELFNSSLALAIGNFGERNQDMYDKVSGRLKEELKKAKDANTMGLMLNSLGNTQNPDIVKSVEPFAYHDESVVRKAAIKAIGKIKGDDKKLVDTIYARMKEETSSDVIAQMGIGLENKKLDKDVVETAASRLEYFNPYEKSVDPAAMVKTVVNNVDKSDVARKKLLLMMGQNFDPRIKNEIIKGLR